MTAITCEPLTEETRPAWDDMAGASDEAWLQHLTAWQDLGTEEGFSGHHFLARSPEGEVVGIFPLVTRREVRARLFRAPVLYGGYGRCGPALRAAMSPDRRRRVLQAMVAHLDHVAHQIGAVYAQVGLAALAPAHLPPRRASVNPLVSFGFAAPPRYVVRTPLIGRFVSLDADAAALWNAVAPERRRLIQQATRHGIAVEEAKDDGAAGRYHALHRETCWRTRAHPKPEKHFAEIWRRFGPAGQARFFFATRAGEDLGAVIALAWKGAATYWAGASRTETLSLRPNDLLIWHSLLWAKEAGCHWYELGPHFPYLWPEAKMRTIGRFKAKFGGLDLYYHEGVKVYRRVRFALLDLAEDLYQGLVALRDRRRGAGNDDASRPA